MKKTLVGALMLALAMAPAAAFAKGDDRGEHRGWNKSNPFVSIPVSSAPDSANPFSGTLNIIGFNSTTGEDGKPNGLEAIGMLNGTLGKGNSAQQVTNEVVRWPILPNAGTGFSTQQVTCDILNLVLGPLHLNLLGLNVDLNQVVLNITGATGAGNLVGNLLCGLFGILDVGGTIAAIGQIVQNLNTILATLAVL